MRKAGNVSETVVGRVKKAGHALFSAIGAEAGWSTLTLRLLPRVMTAMIGLAGPIAAGVLAGRPRIGMAAALGGLALSRGEAGETFHEQAPGLAYSLVAGTGAMFAGVTLGCAGGGGLLTAFTVPAVAGASALLGGMSRSLIKATTLFMLFFVIAVHLGSTGADPMSIALLFLAGGLWTAILSLVLKPLFRAFRPAPPPDTGKHVAPPRYSARQLLRHWRGSLGHPAGWQYTLRMTLCLSAAQVLERVWPLGHGYWLSLTILIVVHRRLDAALKRTSHRAAGTFLGVLFAGILLLGHMPLWAMIATIAVLAAARPVLMETSYTAYAAVQTPLIILLLDFGRAPSLAAAVDRLVCTLAGCCLALALGYLGWRRLSGTVAPTPAGLK